MKPYIHAQNSVKKYGGDWLDYIAIHDFMDSSKAHMADHRHRALFHSTLGIYIAERIFGTVIKNSEGKIISVRDIAEDHVMEDLGTIPSVEMWFRNMRIEPWMSGKKIKNKNSAKKTILFEEPDTLTKSDLYD